jgi:hypothetical protein
VVESVLLHWLQSLVGLDDAMYATSFPGKHKNTFLSCKFISCQTVLTQYYGTRLQLTKSVLHLQLD